MYIHIYMDIQWQCPIPPRAIARCRSGRRTLQRLYMYAVYYCLQLLLALFSDSISVTSLYYY